MSDMPPLPRRWLRIVESARHAEAIKGILDTPPITSHNDGLVLFAEIGNEELLSCLVAVKSLHAQLGKGRVALLDDGTLIGSDRALLAHHCGDPEIIAPANKGERPLPEGPGWRALSTLLERRNSEYWLWLSNDSVTLGPVPEVERAVALNASVVLPGRGALESARPLGDFCRLAYPDGPTTGNITARLESRLAAVNRGNWRYFQGDMGLMGFAAGGPGLRYATASRADLEQLVGAEALSEDGAAQVAANLLLASESRTVILPREHYRHSGSEGCDKNASFLRFGGEDPHADGHYAEASQNAIEALHGQ
ncbi:hypothetical protein [Aurantiacibacter suaedae]|uniref:hypothetical protein n=1 Tax=Aurantiacibacter suaedae TaxID=2545755 RepID=UPI0010F978CF|nr:hypothetical protein [Aurantiacibacter suaedae]